MLTWGMPTKQTIERKPHHRLCSNQVETHTASNLWVLSNIEWLVVDQKLTIICAHKQHLDHHTTGYSNCGSLSWTLYKVEFVDGCNLRMKQMPKNQMTSFYYQWKVWSICWQIIAVRVVITLRWPSVRITGLSSQERFRGARTYTMSTPG